MKKQIFILMMALFAVTSVFGQSPSDPPTCTADALHPAAGNSYNYLITIPNTPGFTGVGNFTWYITTSTNLLTGSHIANSSGEFVASGYYDAATAAKPSIDIVWNAASIATGVNYYLVINYTESNATATPSCPAQNMKVFLIKPQNTFWLKLETALDGTGAAGGAEQCAANISGATVTTTTDPGDVTYSYGQNVLYVKMTASGYTGNFDPRLQLSGLVADQSIGAAGITWAAGATTGTFTGGGANGNGIYTSATQMPSLVAGQAIIITIPIDNNHHENLTDQSIAIAVDGSYSTGGATPTIFKDKSNVGGNCTDGADFEDTVTEKIKARPTINNPTPSLIPSASLLP